MDEVVITVGFPEASRARIAALLADYVRSLGVDLSFQGFEREVASLPGEYAPPAGAFITAAQAGVIGGLVAVRALDGETAEMKRLYVGTSLRGRGVGRRLAEAAVAEARRLGYRRMRLDTLPGMDAAQSLYRAMGFIEIADYNGNPVAGTRFLELDLRQAG